VITDDAGRFELPAGEAKVVAISHTSFDAWPTAIPDEGPVKIVLPAPARVEVELAIDGADKESKVFYQLLSGATPQFRELQLQSMRELPIANGGKVTLAALPPGKFQICRMLTHRTPEFGMSAMLDREFFEIKAGETKSIRWVRDSGARLRGKITWPEGTVLSGTIVSVIAPKAEKDPIEGHDWQTTYSSLLAAADGTYLTERVSPGTYLLRAQAYVPMTPEERSSPRLGLRGPAFQAEMKIDVPAEGEVTLPDLALKPLKR
jgi:hypothetical protein